MEIKIRDRLHIDGRGTVFVVEQRDLPIPIVDLKGMKIVVDGKEWLVRGLELMINGFMQQENMADWRPFNAGLLVKEVIPDEN